MTQKMTRETARDHYLRSRLLFTLSAIGSGSLLIVCAFKGRLDWLSAIHGFILGASVMQITFAGGMIRLGEMLDTMFAVNASLVETNEHLQGVLDGEVAKRKAGC